MLRPDIGEAIGRKLDGPGYRIFGIDEENGLVPLNRPGPLNGRNWNNLFVTLERFERAGLHAFVPGRVGPSPAREDRCLLGKAANCPYDRDWSTGSADDRLLLGPQRCPRFLPPFARTGPCVPPRTGADPMCGIAGFFDPSRGMDVLRRMTDEIAARGPDDSGHHLADGVGLGHRRLSILDLSPLGHQPMRFEHLVTVYNGEIYNFREVADDLSAKGYTFSSASDTEVLLKAFHCWGPRCVERFTGMFAIAIWDERERALYLIRDRAGVKPLYYTIDGDRIGFGSTLKALGPYLSPERRGAIDPDALSEFLANGFIGSGLSILAGVHKVPQAHVLKFAGGRLTSERYWDVSFAGDPAWATRSMDDLVDELEEIAIRAFRYRMVSDVPVGVFLSGGVDSSLVAAILSRHQGPLSTFTIGFEERSHDESADAQRIAAHLGTRHVEATLTPGHSHAILDRLYDIYDEPQGDNAGLPISFVSELAASHGAKVVLSADAGDELFGGYTRYIEFYRRWAQLRRLGRPGRAAARTALRLGAPLLGDARDEQAARFGQLLVEQPFLSFMQRRIADSSSRDLARIFPRYRERLTAGGEGELIDQMCEWDFKHYMADNILIKVDRATMFHSIEGREPFLDHRLVEFAARVPAKFKIDRAGGTKLILKHLLGRYLPRPLFDLPKRGFSAPLAPWAKDHYQDRFADALGADTGFFDPAQMNRLIDRYRTGGPLSYGLLWRLFSFQTWYRHWNTP